MRHLIRHGLDALAIRLAHRIVDLLPQMPSRAELEDVARTTGDRQSDQLIEAVGAMMDERARLSSAGNRADSELLGAARNELEHVFNYHKENHYSVQAASERILLLLGRSAALQVQHLETIRHLGDVEFRVTSQWGEDGIIEWLCHKLPNIPQSFVEFGVENFSEANTRFLMQNRGWTGIVMDAEPGHMESVRRQDLFWKYDLTAVSAFISRENINNLISNHGMHGEIGILSVDIDGNDYWVLKAIDVVNPVIIICENNGNFGDLKSLSIPYIEDFYRFNYHYTGGYYGCSVQALVDLCGRRGYTFIGTNTAGMNAFFVRNDLAPSVLHSLGEIRIWPHRHRGSRDTSGKLVFRRVREKLALIEEMPVVDLETGRTLPLKDLMPLHSDALLKT